MFKYCVYLTCYNGNKMPPFYIGSTSINKINDGYKGSVESKKYKKIFIQELKNNPNYFKTFIISYCMTRKSALSRELELQTKLNVVKSPLYINQSLASPNGSHGRCVQGTLNPMYGRHHSDRTKQKLSMVLTGRQVSVNTLEKRKNTLEKFWNSSASSQKRELLSNLYTGAGNPMYGKKGKNNPNFGRKNTLEGNANISKSLKGKAKSTEHCKKMSRVYTLQEETTLTLFTGYGLGEFCKLIDVSQSHFLYYYGVNKFFKGFKLVSKDGMCGDMMIQSLTEKVIELGLI